MGKAFAIMLGILLGGHGFIGLFVEGEHLLGIFNVDILVDVLYLGLALVLLVVGCFSQNKAAIRGVLVLAGGALVLLGLAGLADDTVAGLLPTGLTLMDFVILFGAGAVSLIMAVLPSTTDPLVNGGERVL
ncbi:hypothetical protein [Labedella endophytica]|uniref:DUF4383 domain-containing protein n=1 Tax=Labedella endophytica TaxID=1523160 RepID=A0A3S0X8K2_9MICO|nr:hypothetical protein [Labedella endophytica]RUR01910.1 hypothetical protein ELQ94_10730 [Labedella endophytica]